ncbi:MAG: class I SAM-dependent methyltransferase [Rhodospirillales bacterium]
MTDTGKTVSPPTTPSGAAASGNWANDKQAGYWNDGAGPKWVRFQGELDASFANVNAALFARAEAAAGETVIDVGCGAGATTFALADRVGPSGRVSGVDISATLLAAARRRAAELGLDNVAFLETDAQTHAFELAMADLVASRFGVMFFEDPAAAFANIRTALRPGGRIAFASWAGLERNVWFAGPREAAIRAFGPPPDADPRAPGPLAFSEIDYVTGILRKAGYGDIRAEEAPVTLVHPGPLAKMVNLVSNIGPAVRIADHHGKSDADIAALGPDLEAVFRPFERPDGVHAPATLNFFMATAP